MIAQDKPDSEYTLIHPAGETADVPGEDKRPTQIRIRIQIPQKYHEEPVISRLISEFGLSVNVNGALLAGNAPSDGWFDLELRGANSQIQRALVYLDEIGVGIWSKSTDPDEENW
ncbi:NIL domain-containing protein [Kamptonema formosum]|uniref:NIL domain-containing protein n=1 Tax=Kamptonema formosum TaxID=331992 RepID=UPI00034B9C0D|nr:NIL domain-containing protein [Oscillatoria sp. PCC 10802]